MSAVASAPPSSKPPIIRIEPVVTSPVTARTRTSGQPTAVPTIEPARPTVHKSFIHRVSVNVSTPIGVDIFAESAAGLPRLSYRGTT